MPGDAHNGFYGGVGGCHSGPVSYPCPALGHCIPSPECVAGDGHMSCCAAVGGQWGSRPQLGAGVGKPDKLLFTSRDVGNHAGLHTS